MSSDSIFASRKTACAGATSAARFALASASVRTDSSTLNTKMKGFAVSRPSSRIGARSIPDADSSVPRSRASFAASAVSSTTGSSFLPLTSFSYRVIAFSSVCRSASWSSALIVSMSFFGSTAPSTCTTSESAKPRTTWAMASASRMLARNWLPRPSPSDAPRTMPAMSTNETLAGRIRSEPKISARVFKRGSGRFTTPTFGSIVANG